MLIHFTKMHGLGNDFMVINGLEQKINLTPELIQQWSDRHTGVGFDQLLLIEKPRLANADFFYRIFNADGTEVAQCGNGARCIAQFLHDENLTTKNNIRVETLTDVLELTLMTKNQVKVNLGMPNFNAEQIPFLSDKENKNHIIQEENFSAKYSFTYMSNTYSMVILSIGNPHAVISTSQLEHIPVSAIGEYLNQHAQFSQGVNVSFMQIDQPNHINLRVYERGAGETLACGSGACAAVIAGRILGLLDENVRVTQAGGDLQVSWHGKQHPVYLTGPACTVFKGVIS